MNEAIIMALTEIVTTLIVTLIGVLGAWLLSVMAKRQELSSINEATQEAIRLAQLTAAELQQTVVGNLKAASADGKLTEAEIKALGKQLVEQTKRKMSGPAYKLLEASAVDINGLIRGAGEEWINKIKNEPVLELGVPVETE